MDLNNEIGRKITAQRHDQLAAYQKETSAIDVALESEREKQAEIEKLNRPYELTLKLMASRGYEPYIASPSARQSVQIKHFEICEKFRLKPTVVEAGGEDKTASLDLVIRTRIRETNPGYGDIPGPFKLFVAMHIPEERLTEHYLTDIHKPLIKGNGLPENYGMRTYRTVGKDSYEVDSSVPRDEEAEVIASAIMEAAELAGLYHPYVNQD